MRRKAGSDRNRWFDDYMNLVIERDVAELSRIRQRHLLETFCVGEILKQVSWLEIPAQPGHWRTHDGDEVDLVLERDDGAVACVEVKAGERVPEKDFRGMRKLRDALGDRFLGGVVLHLGRRAYTVEDRLHALPADCLWRTD